MTPSYPKRMWGKDMIDKMESEEHGSKWSVLPKKEYTQAAYLEGDAIM